jgi:hypothetical protein
VNLLKNDYEITGYFYNPNIHPEDEYIKRVEEMKRYAKKVHINLICAGYDSDRWFEMVKGLEDVPEGGERCFLCYRMRLEKTAQYGEEYGFDLFTTTLSISPHKNALKINEIGAELGEKYNIQFYSADFKKQGGFEQSVLMSKEGGLYRQSYCGCIFSRQEAAKRRRSRRK